MLKHQRTLIMMTTEMMIGDMVVMMLGDMMVVDMVVGDVVVVDMVVEDVDMDYMRIVAVHNRWLQHQKIVIGTEMIEMTDLMMMKNLVTEIAIITQTKDAGESEILENPENVEDAIEDLEGMMRIKDDGLI